jgi:hypothetical protein
MANPADIVEYVALEGLRGCSFDTAWYALQLEDFDVDVKKWVWRCLCEYEELEFWDCTASPTSSASTVGIVLSKQGVVVSGSRVKLANPPSFETCLHMKGNLRLVAAFFLRCQILGLSGCTSNLDANRFCTLEEIGRSRAGGILQSDISNQLNMKPGDLHRHMMPLWSSNLIIRNHYVNSTNRTSLLRLSRFHSFQFDLDLLKGLDPKSDKQMKKFTKKRLEYEKRKEEDNDLPEESRNYCNLFSNLTMAQHAYRFIHAAGPEGVFTSDIRQELGAKLKPFEHFFSRFVKEYDVTLIADVKKRTKTFRVVANDFVSCQPPAGEANRAGDLKVSSSRSKPAENAQTVRRKEKILALLEEMKMIRMYALTHLLSDGETLLDKRVLTRLVKDLQASGKLNMAEIASPRVNQDKFKSTIVCFHPSLNLKDPTVFREAAKLVGATPVLAVTNQPQGDSMEGVNRLETATLAPWYAALRGFLQPIMARAWLLHEFLWHQQNISNSNDIAHAVLPNEFKYYFHHVRQMLSLGHFFQIVGWAEETFPPELAEDIADLSKPTLEDFFERPIAMLPARQALLASARWKMYSKCHSLLDGLGLVRNSGQAEVVSSMDAGLDPSNREVKDVVYTLMPVVNFDNTTHNLRTKAGRLLYWTTLRGACLNNPNMLSQAFPGETAGSASLSSLLVKSKNWTLKPLDTPALQSCLDLQRRFPGQWVTLPQAREIAAEQKTSILSVCLYLSRVLPFVRTAHAQLGVWTAFDKKSKKGKHAALHGPHRSRRSRKELDAESSENSPSDRCDPVETRQQPSRLRRRNSSGVKNLGNLARTDSAMQSDSSDPEWRPNKQLRLEEELEKEVIDAANNEVGVEDAAAFESLPQVKTERSELSRSSLEALPLSLPPLDDRGLQDPSLRRLEAVNGFLAQPDWLGESLAGNTSGGFGELTVRAAEKPVEETAEKEKRKKKRKRVENDEGRGGGAMAGDEPSPEISNDLRTQNAKLSKDGPAKRHKWRKFEDNLLLAAYETWATRYYADDSSVGGVVSTPLTNPLAPTKLPPDAEQGALGLSQFVAQFLTEVTPKQIQKRFSWWRRKSERISNVPWVLCAFEFVCL